MNQFNSSTNNPRHQARIIAFEYLFGSAVSPTSTQSAEVFAISKEQFFQFCGHFNHAKDDFAFELVEGIGKNLPEIDEKIKSISTHWKIDRISKVDLNLLRMGVFEIAFRPDIPKSVTINEYIEIAKQYGEKDSSSFINGILDKITKSF